MVEELKANGIAGPNLQRIAEARRHTAFAVRMLALSLRGQPEIKNPSALLASKLLDGAEVPVSAREAARHQRHIASIRAGDRTFTLGGETTLGYNASGLVIRRNGEPVLTIHEPITRARFDLVPLGKVAA